MVQFTATIKEVDVVHGYGWAYGPGGVALEGKELLLAISIGGRDYSYRVGSYNILRSLS